MSTLPPPAPNKDSDQLNLLAIFHYVVGGLTALFACFPIIHVFIGAMMMINPGSASHGNDQAPQFMGVLFVLLGIGFILLGWTAAICTVLSGRMLARRRNHTFSFVVAVVLCLFMPFGTILGIFTIIVLSRESVKQLYTAAR